MRYFTNDDNQLLNRLGFVFPQGRIRTSDDWDYREMDKGGIHMEVRLSSIGTYFVYITNLCGAWQTAMGDSLQSAFTQAIEALEKRSLKQLDLAHASKILWNQANELKEKNNGNQN